MLSRGHKVPVRGFIDTSFIDWKGQISSVIFTEGCNFRCPYCHNSGLVLNPDQYEEIPMEDILGNLRKYKNWVERVVITGGEPTINAGLGHLIDLLKKEGMKIKLDTNGSLPPVIKRLVNNGLVDYIAMDVKGPFNHYKRWCGVDIDGAVIEESVRFIMGCGVDYEFRMTAVPFLHREDDIYETADSLKGARRFFIQEFKPNNTLDPAFMSIKPFGPEKITKIRQVVSERMILPSAKASLST